MKMTSRPLLYPFAAVLVTVAVATGYGFAAGSESSPTPRSDKGDKPSLSVKVRPPVSFTPSQVYAVAEFKGGRDDYEDYYCGTVEWEWGDGTVSEASADCQPYEEGKSEIKRRFSATHRYETAGAYRVQFRLKRNNKVLVAGSASVQLRPGLREPYLDRP